MKRLGLCLLVLLVAVPTFAARRRAVAPADPNRCTFTGGPVARATYPEYLATDATHVYWINENGELLRAPKVGDSDPELVTDLFQFIPLTLALDGDRVYLGVLPFSFTGPKPGEILSVPKTGGAVTTLVTGVATPFGFAFDDTYIYWAALGTLDFQEEEILADGKIERARKSDGSGRQTLAQNLSAPADLLVEGDHVYYGETGLAKNDTTVGLFRVPKNGGTIVTLDGETASADLAFYGDSIIVWGGDDEHPQAFFRIKKDGSGKQVLLSDENLDSGPQVVGDRIYYTTYVSDTEGSTLRWIPATGGAPVDVRTDRFVSVVVDECSITFGSDTTANLERIPR